MSADSISVGEIFPDYDGVKQSPERAELENASAEAEKRIRAYTDEVRDLMGRHRARAIELRSQAEIEDEIAARYERFLTNNVLEDQAASGNY